MAVTVLKHIKEAKNRSASAHLKNSIKYVMNPKKTEDGLWIGGNVGTDPQLVYEAMMETKADFQKLSGRQGYHFVISFSPGEADAETTFKIGGEFCRQYLGDAYDYVYAVHTDQHHSHCHIVFNSVNRYDGTKYRYINGDWEKYIQPITDELCIRHDLDPLQFDRQKKKGKTYAERRAELDGRMTGKDIIRYDIDYAISVSNTFEEFLQNMKSQGYRIREGYSEAKGIPFFTYYAPGLGKGRRDYNLGAGYRIVEIKERIASGEWKPLLPAAKIPSAPVISNLWKRAEGNYQKGYVLRVVYAVFYHSFPTGIPDSYSVRKDLLEINKLQEECALLMEYQLTDAGAAGTLLSRLKEEERHCRETGDSEGHLEKIRHDKKVIRRLLKRGTEDSLSFTETGSGSLQLPEPVRKVLYQEEQKRKDVMYGTNGIERNNGKSLR